MADSPNTPAKIINSMSMTSRLQAALAGLGLCAMTALAAGYGGYNLGHKLAAADGTAAIDKLKLDHTSQLATAAANALVKERELTRVANQLGALVGIERAQHAQQSDQLKRRIDHVTSQYRPAPGAPLQPAPRCVFTNGFVGVWNGAIGAGGSAPVPATDAAAGTADATGAAEALDSGVRAADILGHVVDYGLRCRDMESQLNRLIDWHQGAKP